MGEQACRQPGPKSLARDLGLFPRASRIAISFPFLLMLRTPIVAIVLLLLLAVIDAQLCFPECTPLQTCVELSGRPYCLGRAISLNPFASALLVLLVESHWPEHSHEADCQIWFYVGFIPCTSISHARQPTISNRTIMM